MFGYVRADIENLRVGEYAFYRCVYCGLCRTMGKVSGRISRFTLSYDFTFLALLRLYFSPERPELVRRRCLPHPFVRHDMVRENEPLRFAAAAAAILADEKVLDDLADERGRERFRARIRRLYTKGRSAKADRMYPGLRQGIRERLGDLSALESQKSAYCDELAQRFGKLLGFVTSFGLSGDDATLARQIGETVGHWIYVMDAFADREEDRKRGRYNPLLEQYGPDGFSPERLERMENAVLNEILGADLALGLMDRERSPQSFAVLDNILHRGLPRVTRQVLGGTFDRKKKEREAIA